MTSRFQFWIVFALVAALCAPFALAQQQPAAKATMQGIVTNGRTGEPIAGARVTLTELGVPASRPGQQRPPFAASTADRSGSFVLADIDAGTYAFSVGNEGFARYNNPRLVLAPGQVLKDMVVRIVPAGNVSGRVSNAAGRPAIGVTVNLLRRTFATNGVPSLSVAASAVTDDRGEYRMFWVTPGRYYLTNEAPISMGDLNELRYRLDDAQREGLNDVRENYTQTYFPGVPDLEKASLIDVQEGAELRGLDLTVSRQQRFAIQGRVVDSSTGQPPAKLSITLSQRTLSGSTASSGPRNYNPATGTFELLDLPPGTYGIGVYSGDRTYFGAPPAGVAWASSVVAVSDAGVADLVMRVGVPPVITGHLKFEGPLPAGTGLERIRVTLNPTTPGMFFANSNATPAPDGTFSLNTLPDGLARVSVSGLPAGFYLKDANLDGTDVLQTPFKFAGSGNLEVTISANGGQLEGRVFDAKMQPVSGVEAVLIPDESRSRSELFKRAVTNPEGRFTISGIAPGDYKLLAWESLEPNSFFDEQVLSKFERKGTPVRIAESSKASLEVTLITEEAAQ